MAHNITEEGKSVHVAGYKQNEIFYKANEKIK